MIRPRPLPPLFRACLCAALLLQAAAAGAVTALDFQTVSQGRNSTVNVAIQDGRVRIEEGGSGWMLYDSGKDNVILVDPQRRSYVEMTRAEMRRYGQQVGAARALVGEHLKNLPPEQRAALEKYMGGKAEPEPMTFEKTGQRREVNGYACSTGRLLRGGKPVEEFCVASPDAIKMPKDDYATLRRMYALMSELQEAGAPGMMPNYEKIDGVPVEVREPGGDVQSVARISHQRLPEDKFQVPAGYTREDLGKAILSR